MKQIEHAKNVKSTKQIMTSKQIIKEHQMFISHIEDMSNGHSQIVKSNHFKKNWNQVSHAKQSDFMREIVGKRNMRKSSNF